MLQNELLTFNGDQIWTEQIRSVLQPLTFFNSLRTYFPLSVSSTLSCPPLAQGKGVRWSASQMKQWARRVPQIRTTCKRKIGFYFNYLYNSDKSRMVSSKIDLIFSIVYYAREVNWMVERYGSSFFKKLALSEKFLFGEWVHFQGVLALCYLTCPSPFPCGLERRYSVGSLCEPGGVSIISSPR